MINSRQARYRYSAISMVLPFFLSLDEARQLHLELHYPAGFAVE